MKSFLVKAAFLVPLIFGSVTAQAAIVRVEEGNFTPQAGLITFSEFAVGTTNPTYAPATYGGGASAPTVTFGGYFSGQSLSATPSVDCPGAAASACVVGTASGPLQFAANAPATQIVTDTANPTSPVLSGSPIFNGPISVIFSTDQVAVGFDAGYFDAPASTAIFAYARDGSELGFIANRNKGIEFLGLATADGSARIAGVGLRLVGNEPAGFGIDNLRFGVAGQVDAVPEPATWAMLILGFGLIGGALRGARREARSKTGLRAAGQSA